MGIQRYEAGTLATGAAPQHGSSVPSQAHDTIVHNAAEDLASETISSLIQCGHFLQFHFGLCNLLEAAAISLQARAEVSLCHSARYKLYVGLFANAALAWYKAMCHCGDALNLVERSHTRR